MSSTRNKKVTAIIVAAGRGSRMGGEGPKQYANFAEKTVLYHAVKAFLLHPEIAQVRVVIHPEDGALYAKALEEFVKEKQLLSPVYGGGTRQESVRLGLLSLQDTADFVLIHDAARPCVDAATISRVIAGLEGRQGVIPVIPLADTLKRVDAKGRITQTVERAGLFQAQTPQGFDYVGILEAHEQAATKGIEVTDDAALYEAFGYPVATVPGSVYNKKITTADDLMQIEQQMNKLPDIRTGSGFDVHRFRDTAPPSGAIMLGGVAVPHSYAIEAHSDGDVILHALTDALLGTIGAGDIGQHFPPSDPQWKDADSSAFLRHAVGLVTKANGRITHTDVTVICERPKMAPHMLAICAHIAEILGIDASRVSIKATTTEGLGFTGRREGIAAQAVATVVIG
jgi:2-C-methyl-D-erythritol 4-phosphate cytidylyltransferase/2-C-methyl-D-erythritol 2,4-cyclodiphosphate synthase